MINQIAFLAHFALVNPTQTFQVRYFHIDVIGILGGDKWGEWKDIDAGYEYKDSKSKEEHYMLVLSNIINDSSKPLGSYEYRLKPEVKDD